MMDWLFGYDNYYKNDLLFFYSVITLFCLIRKTNILKIDKRQGEEMQNGNFFQLLKVITFQWVTFQLNTTVTWRREGDRLPILYMMILRWYSPYEILFIREKYSSFSLIFEKWCLEHFATLLCVSFSLPLSIYLPLPLSFSLFLIFECIQLTRES